MPQTNQEDPGLPDRAEEGASDGAAFKAVAQPSRRTPAAIALAGIAVLAFALLTKQAAPPAVAEATMDVTPQPSRVAVAASVVAPTVAPTVATTPSPTQWPPVRNPTVTPYPAFAAVHVGAGATRLIPAGPAPVRLTISLPDGWAKASDAMYVKANGAAPAGLSIGAWSLRHVNIFPCRWSSQEFADPPLMRTAEGQAEALSDWWGQDSKMPPPSNSRISPLASKPRHTTIQGYPAWYLEVLIPSGLDFTECDAGQLVLWDTADGGVRYSLGPGEIHRLWVVDVGGELVVIDAASFHATSSADAGELQAVVDSVVIEP